MAQGKKDGGSASKKKGSGTEKKAKAAEESAAEKAAEASEPEAPHSDGHKAEAHGDHGDHEHAPNRKEYMYVFLALAILTVIEVAVAQPSLGISRTLVGLALVGLAVTKAATVGLYYMHLKHETRVLRLTIAIPMMAPAVYALVLISEGAWRLAR